MKKIMSFLMAVITLMGSFAGFPANTAFASTEESVNGVFSATLAVQPETSRPVTLILQGDSPLGPASRATSPGRQPID